MLKSIKEIYGHQNIDGLIPGVKGQRAFPSQEFMQVMKCVNLKKAPIQP